MGNIDLCLYSLFIGHGILDFLILGKRIDYLFWYIGIIILYNLLLVLCHELFLTLFIILSGYHFGVDFKFITNDTTNLSIFTGWFFISSTLFCDNFQGITIWKEILEDFNFSEKEYDSTVDFIRQTYFLSLFALISGYDKLNPILLSLVFVIFLHVSKFDLMAYFLVFVDCFHVPITLRRFYNIYGKVSVILLLFGTIVSYKILDNLVVEENQFGLAISISMAHMVFMTLWEHKII
jgi:hypothetical protein